MKSLIKHSVSEIHAHSSEKLFPKNKNNSNLYRGQQFTFHNMQNDHIKPGVSISN